ncbi:MAG: Rho termination factor N-terminal domain-containing protein [bacterium]
MAVDQRDPKPAHLPHLAELHSQAQELDIPHFRGMRKEELAKEIGKRSAKGGKRGPGLFARIAALFGGGKGTKKSRKPARGGKTSSRASARGDEGGFEVSGTFDRMPKGYGFIRLEKGSKSDQDSYISPSQIRRCKLRPGDEVKGVARDPREGERHRALVRVLEVNGKKV